MTKQMCVCRIERVKGDGGGLGTETKRKYSDGRDYSPNNVSKERSHLNRQIIGKGNPSLCGGDYVVSAINSRIASAELKRKVGKNQCRALIAYLSGTHEQMMEILNQGRLDEWVNANVEWLHQTFGADNVVTVDLHMDEYTPHLHAVIVPITSNPRTRRPREGVAKYQTNRTGNRLCADDIMKKSKLVEYQDSYAEAMSSFGLERGEHGSQARHQTMNEYYRTLREERIPEAEERLVSVEEEVKEKESVSEMLSQEHEKKREDINRENGSAIRRGLASLVGKTIDEQVAEKDKEIAKLKKELAELRRERRSLKKKIEDMSTPLSQKQIAAYQKQVEDLTSSIKAINAELKRIQTENSDLQAFINDEPNRLKKAKEEAREESERVWQRRYGHLKDSSTRSLNEKQDEVNRLQAQLDQANAFIMGTGKMLYASGSLFAEAVRCIGKFIHDAFEEIGQCRDFLYPEEADLFWRVGGEYGYSYVFAKLIGETARGIFGWNDYKTDRAIREIWNVFEGRYYKNSSGLNLLS